MAHLILAHDTMVSANNITPWHRLGTVYDGELSAEEAFAQAKLDWHVAKEPVVTRLAATVATKAEDLINSLTLANWGKPDATLAELLVDIGFDIPITDKFATIREDISYPLGIVGIDYRTFQNSAGYKLVKALAGDSKIETSGSLNNGRTVWVLVRVSDDISIGGDTHSPYLLFTWSHDGSSAVRIMPTAVRVVCANTLRMALSRAQASWSFSHTQHSTVRASEVAKTLSLAGKYYEEFAVTVEQLMDQRVTETTFERILTDIVPDPVPTADGKVSSRALNNAQTKRGEIRRIYTRSIEVKDFTGTGWGVVQAFNTFDLWKGKVHGGEGMRPERQATRILSGETMANTSRVRELLTTAS